MRLGGRGQVTRQERLGPCAKARGVGSLSPPRGAGRGVLRCFHPLVPAGSPPPAGIPPAARVPVFSPTLAAPLAVAPRSIPGPAAPKEDEALSADVLLRDPVLRLEPLREILKGMARPPGDTEVDRGLRSLRRLRERQGWPAGRSATSPAERGGTRLRLRISTSRSWANCAWTS